MRRRALVVLEYAVEDGRPVEWEREIRWPINGPSDQRKLQSVEVLEDESA